MKKTWNGFINFSLLIAGIETLIKGINRLIRFGSNSPFVVNAYSGTSGGYRTGYQLGNVVGSILAIPVAIAIFYLFYERVFKKSLLKAK